MLLSKKNVSCLNLGIIFGKYFKAKKSLALNFVSEKKIVKIENVCDDNKFGREIKLHSQPIWPLTTHGTSPKLLFKNFVFL